MFCSAKKASRIDDIYNYECHMALLVSLLSPKLCGPEAAFHKLGINCVKLPGDRQQKIDGVLALAKLGWSWEDIGDYFGFSGIYAWKLWKTNGGKKYGKEIQNHGR